MSIEVREKLVKLLFKFFPNAEIEEVKDIAVLMNELLS